MLVSTALSFVVHNNYQVGIVVMLVTCTLNRGFFHRDIPPDRVMGYKVCIAIFLSNSFTLSCTWKTYYVVSQDETAMLCLYIREIYIAMHATFVNLSHEFHLTVI